MTLAGRTWPTGRLLPHSDLDNLESRKQKKTPYNENKPRKWFAFRGFQFLENLNSKGKITQPRDLEISILSRAIRAKRHWTFFQDLAQEHLLISVDSYLSFLLYKFNRKKLIGFDRLIPESWMAWVSIEMFYLHSKLGKTWL